MVSKLLEMMDSLQWRGWLQVYWCGGIATITTLAVADPPLAIAPRNSKAKCEDIG